MIRQTSKYLVMAALISFASFGNAGTSTVSPALAACSRALVESIRAFVGRTLTEDRIEELAARVYENYFDAAELKALAEFQRSDVGRKAARLTPVIGRETSRAIEGEIAQSPALPRLIEEIGREFPVLRGPETP